MGTVVLSFDDGGKDTMRLAMELEKRSLPATFNIVTSWVDGRGAEIGSHVTVEEIKELSAKPLFEFAAHGDSHKNSFEDITASVELLREWCEMSEIGFASPGSGMTLDYIKENEESLSSLGLSYVRTGSYKRPVDCLEASTYLRMVMGQAFDALDSMGVPSAVVCHNDSLEDIKRLADYVARENKCVVYMFHAVRKEGEKNSESQWSYDFDKFCEFADYLCKLRLEKKLDIVTTMTLVKRMKSK